MGIVLGLASKVGEGSAKRQGLGLALTYAVGVMVMVRIQLSIRGNLHRPRPVEFNEAP